MTMQATSRWRIALDTKLLDDLEKLNLAASIAKLAPQSVLISIPAVAASVAAIAKKAAALNSGNQAVDADDKQLKNDITARDSARVALDTELVSLKALLVNNATTASDITGLGYTLLDLTTSTGKPDVPLCVVMIGKQHGKAKVSVAGTTRGRFVAESAPDPIAGPWTRPDRHRPVTQAERLRDRHQDLGPLRPGALRTSVRLEHSGARDHPLMALRSGERRAGRCAYPRSAAIAMPGTFSQLGAASMATIFSATTYEFWWVTNHGGLGVTVSGPRITAFSMPSSMKVLCTQPSPPWMSSGVDEGCAPQGGVTVA